MNDQTEPQIPMHVAELRRTQAREPGVERHILFLEDDQGRRLSIWIGAAEATAMALILEQVQLPRPGVYQFAASLLAGAGGRSACPRRRRTACWSPHHAGGCSTR